MLFLTVRGILYPLLGTLFGSAFVFFSKNKPTARFSAILDSFAAGIMCAASFFSLILPAVNQASDSSTITQLSCSTGFFAGIFIFIILSEISEKIFELKSHSGNMLVWAVSLHNIPEGMAVGVVFAGMQTGETTLTLAAAFALAIGMAVQNVPEGAIISMPLRAEGVGRGKTFLYGALSGVVEPIAAILTLLFLEYTVPAMPFLLAFSAGAMLYVVVEELIPASQQGKHSNLGTIGFALGFALMMVLDVILG